MYAVIETGGQQLRVEVGDVVRVARLEEEVGGAVVFDRVLMVGGDDDVKLGSPAVDGAKVRGTVVAQDRDRKVLVYTYKRRKNSARKRQGHRQFYEAKPGTQMPTSDRNRIDHLRAQFLGQLEQIALGQPTQIGRRHAGIEKRCLTHCTCTLFLLAAGPTLAGFGLYNVSLSYLPSSVVNLIVTLEPVFTASLAYILLGEIMSSMQIVGSLLILAGVVLLRLLGSRKNKGMVPFSS